MQTLFLLRMLLDGRVPLRTFGPNFKLAYHMYFWFAMIVNKENTNSNKIETFRDIAAQTKMDATTQHYYKISWATVDGYAIHRSKLPGATTRQELNINDGDETDADARWRLCRDSARD